jgi:membrane protease subunit HflK
MNMSRIAGALPVRDGGDDLSTEETPGLRPILLVLGAMFAFSLMALFTRGAQANILGVAAWRAIFVAVVFGASAVMSEGGVQALKPDAVTLRLGGWLGLALAIASSTFVGGYAFTTVANTIFLHNLAPVAVFPLAFWLYKERPGSAAVMGAIVALFGVALLSGVSLFQVSHFASSRFLFGDFLAFISAIGYAAVLVLTRMTRREQTPILGTLFLAWSVAAVLLSIVAIAAGGFSVPAASLIWVLGLAIISTNIPFYLLNLGMKQVSAGMAAVLSLSEVLFATILGILVYGEHLAPIGWIGAALAGVGVLYAVTQRDQESEGHVDGTMLSEDLRTPRMLRAGLGLLLLNVGAVCAVGGWWSSAPLAAIAGLAALARFGPGVAGVLLDGRFSSVFRWIGVGLGGLVAWASFQWAGHVSTAPSLWFGLVLLGFLLADERCAQREPEGQRDGWPIGRMALGLFSLGLIFSWMGHGVANIAIEAANLALGLSGLVAVIAGLQGLSGAVAPMEEPFARWTTGTRPRMAIVSVWLLGAFHSVPTGHVGIIERFGAPVGQTEGAGLVVRFPPPLETLTTVNIGAERQLQLPAHTLLTGDQSMVSLSGVIRYAVTDANLYAYGVTEPEKTVLELARAALVEVVARQDQDAVLTTGRASVESTFLALLQSGTETAGLGVTVSAVHLTDVKVPAPVLGAFLDVISADEERRTSMNRAEAYAADLLPRTRGEAVAAVVGAQGDAARIEADAVGYDVWFRSIQRNGKASPAVTRARIAAETREAQLQDVRLIAAPADVRVWLSNEDNGPREPYSSDGGQGR